ncbi:MAG: hypothetical protein V4501_05750 [Pseudomonadota bacterium]
MDKRRILSFEASQKVNDSEIKQVVAGQMNFCIETSIDPKTGKRIFTLDNRS